MSVFVWWLHRRSQTAPRGVALVTTVLLGVVGATIALVAMMVALSVVRYSSSSSSIEQARFDAEAITSRYETRLAEDPLYYRHWVDIYERARVCTESNGVTSVVEPDNPWPASCSDSWSYQDVSAGVAPSRVYHGRMEVTPPSPSTPFLDVKVLASDGTTESGVERTYTLDAASGSVVATDKDLHLDATTYGVSSATTIRGDIYTGGTLFLPTDPNVTVNDGLLMAEEGFAPQSAEAATSSRRYFTATPTAPEEDIRSVLPAPLSVSQLQAGAATLENIACSQADSPGPVPSGPPGPELCLRDGATVMTSAGSPVQVPAGVKVWLLRFKQGGTPPDDYTLIEVWYSTRDLAFIESCDVHCSLPALAATEVASGTHAGALGFYDAKLGDFYVPSSGVLFTDVDTVVGLCGNGFLSASGACDVSNLYDSVTVATGDLGSPANILIGGPLHVADQPTLADAEARLGLVASGRVYIPYWARTPGGDLTVDAAIVALGLGENEYPAVTSGDVALLPQTVYTGYSGDENNQGNLFTLRGSLVAPSLDLSSNQYPQTVVQWDDRLLTSPPPYAPSFTSSWLLRSGRKLSALDVCGAADCPGWGN